MGVGGWVPEKKQRRFKNHDVGMVELVWAVGRVRPVAWTCLASPHLSKLRSIQPIPN